MTEDVEQGIDVGELIIVDNEKPTPEPQKPKSLTEQFIEALLPYGDPETAKSHIPAIAEKLGCAKSLGYKALKKIKKRKLWVSGKPQTIEPEEPTVKIREVEPEPIETTEPEPPEEEELEIEEEALEEPTAPLVESETIIKLRPVLERSVGRIFDSIVNLASGSKAEGILTTQESTTKKI